MEQPYLAGLHLGESGLGQQGLHGSGLVPAVFQQQPAARGQMARGLGDDLADVLQAVGAAGQGLQGFMRQGAQVRVAFGHIRRVGDDQIEGAGHRIHPVALHKVHGQVQTLGVGAGHGQGVGARVHGGHGASGALMLQGQGHGPAARAQVQHALRAALGQQFQGPFHQRLGVGTRVEHTGVHLQAQAKEFLEAGDVGDGLACQSALQQTFQPNEHVGRQFIAVMRQQPGTVMGLAAQCMQVQQLGVDAGQAQGLGVPQALGQGDGGHATPPISSSASCSA